MDHPVHIVRVISTADERLPNPSDIRAGPLQFYASIVIGEGNRDRLQIPLIIRLAVGFAVAEKIEHGIFLAL